MIDKNLTFEKYIDNLVRKARHRLHPPRCVRKFLTIEKAKTLDNGFIDSQFNYVYLRRYDTIPMPIVLRTFS